MCPVMEVWACKSLCTATMAGYQREEYLLLVPFCYYHYFRLLSLGLRLSLSTFKMISSAEAWRSRIAQRNRMAKMYAFLFFIIHFTWFGNEYYSQVVAPINHLLDTVPFTMHCYSLDWHPSDHVSFIDNAANRKFHEDSKVPLINTPIICTQWSILFSI